MNFLIKIFNQNKRSKNNVRQELKSDIAFYVMIAAIIGSLTTGWFGYQDAIKVNDVKETFNDDNDDSDDEEYSDTTYYWFLASFVFLVVGVCAISESEVIPWFNLSTQQIPFIPDLNVMLSIADAHNLTITHLQAYFQVIFGFEWSEAETGMAKQSAGLAVKFYLIYKNGKFAVVKAVLGEAEAILDDPHTSVNSKSYKLAKNIIYAGRFLFIFLGLEYPESWDNF